MESIILIIIALIPVFVVGKYIYKKDNEKEPKKLLKKLLLGGVLSAIAVIIISLILGNFFPLMNKDITELSTQEIFIYAFICVALVEEGCKFFFLYIYSYHSREFDYSFDMIVYSTFIALGFAAFENILYVLSGGIAIGILRALTAVPLHACDGVFMGMFLSKAKQKELKNEPGAFLDKILAILVPVILHGMYDFCAFSSQLLVIITIVIVILTVSIVFVNEKKKMDIKIQYKNNYCPKCGQIVNGNFCIKCGNKNE